MRGGDADLDGNGGDVRILGGGPKNTGHYGRIGLGQDFDPDPTTKLSRRADTTFIQIANVNPVIQIQDTAHAGFSQIGRFSFKDKDDPATGSPLGTGTERLSIGLVGDGTGDAEFKLLNDKPIRIKTNNVEVVRIDAPSGSNSVMTLNGGLRFNAGVNPATAVLADSPTAPTIASGFGTSPSIVANNGTIAFVVNVGTGGTASAGVITLPTATTGWICHVENITAVAANRADQRTVQTASSTTSITVQNQTVSTGAALAWTASDKLVIIARAY